MVTNQHKIIMGICMPRALKEQIDQKLRDVPRSIHFQDLERQLVCVNNSTVQSSASSDISGVNS
jgi:hypothetical protein